MNEQIKEMWIKCGRGGSRGQISPKCSNIFFIFWVGFLKKNMTFYMNEVFRGALELGSGAN